MDLNLASFLVSIAGLITGLRNNKTDKERNDDL